MKIITLPHNNKSIVLFEKSGSSLLSNLFKFICNWKGIEIKNTGNLNMSNLVLVARNPLSRFVSSFFHSKVDRDTEITDLNILIPQFESFVDEYEENKESITDSHIYSQLWSFEKDGIDIRVNPNCKIYHIEDIHNGFDTIVKDKFIANSNIDYKTTTPFTSLSDFDNLLPIFEELGVQFDEWDKFHIVTAYYFILRSLDRVHHRGYAKQFINALKWGNPSLYGRVFNLFYEETYTLKYPILI